MIDDALDTWLKDDSLEAEDEVVARLRAMPATSTLPAIKDRLDDVLTVSVADAEKLARLAVALVDGASPPHLRALAVRCHAQVLHVRGEYGPAAEAYAEAAELHEEACQAEQAAQVRKTRIDPLMYLGRVDEAEAEGKRAREVFERFGDRHRLAELNVNLGNLYLREGRPDEARESYTAALKDIPEDRKTLRGVAALNLGNALVATLDFQQAERAFEDAARLFEEEGRDALLAEALYAGVYLDLERGRHGELLSRTDRARAAYASQRHRRGEALCLQARGRSLLAQGLPGPALSALEESDALFEELGVASERGRGSVLAAEAYRRLGRPGSASRALETAREHFESDGNDVLAEYVRVLALERASPTDESVEPALRKSLALFNQRGVRREAARVSLVLGERARLAGRLEAASRHLDEARSRMATVPDPVFRLESRRLEADLRRAAGDPLGERAALELAMEDIEILAALAGAHDLALGVARDTADVPRRLAHLHADSGDFSEALRLALVAGRTRWRGRFDVDEPRRRALLEELQALYRAQITRDRSGSPPDPGVVARIADREERLRETLRGRTVMGGAAVSTRAPILDPWPPKTGVVVYLFTDEGDWALFARGSGDVGGVPLPEAPKRFHWGQRLLWEMERRADRRPGASGEAPEALEGLARALLAPIQPALEGLDRLFLVTDAVTGSWPLEALPFGESPWGERMELVRCTGGVDDLVVAEAPISPDGPVLLAGGGDKTAPAMGRELDDLERLWGERCRRTPLGTMPEALSRGGALAHLAAHGFLRLDAPEFGGLVHGSDVLHFHSFTSRRIACPLVVLSGCQSALSDARFDGAAPGLAGALLAGGADRVLTSLWPVEDESARRFMRCFHGALKGGETPSRARSIASRQLRQARYPLSDWAPWVLKG